MQTDRSQVKTTGPRMNNRQLNITLNEFTFKAPKVKFAESYKDTEMYNPQTCLSSGNNLPFYLAYIAKSIGSPPYIKRFDYFRNFHEFTS